MALACPHLNNHLASNDFPCLPLDYLLATAEAVLFWLTMNYGMIHRTITRCQLSNFTDWILDGGYLPHAVIRIGIRRLLRERIDSISRTNFDEALEEKLLYIKRLREMPMAVETDAANTQHYEVGTGILAASLGPRLKYSCCLYPTQKETLPEAEDLMLQSYIEKAELKDGMSVLDLG